MAQLHMLCWQVLKDASVSSQVRIARAKGLGELGHLFTSAATLQLKQAPSQPVRACKILVACHPTPALPGLARPLNFLILTSTENMTPFFVIYAPFNLQMTSVCN